MTIYYTFTPLSDPTPHSGEYTFGNDINNSGQVVGTFQHDHDDAFLYDGGTYTNIDLSNYINTDALSISNDGHVLAKAATGGFAYFVYDTITHSDTILNVPGPALDISNAGVVGNYLNGTKSLGFIYENGSYVSIDIPGSTQVFAKSINDSGQVVGYWSDGISSHGFLDVGGVITPINDPNAGVSGTVVKYINNDGQIAGYYTDANNVTHGFLYDHGTFTDIVDPLASPDGYNTHIYGISDAGVFGSYSNATGNHGFIYKDGVYTTVDDHTASSSEVVAMSDSGQLILMIRNGFVESIEIGTLQVGTPVNPTVVADHDHVNLYQKVIEDAAHGVLANDTDPIPTDVLSVTAVNGLAKVGTPVQGLYGALTLAANGSYAYTTTGVLPGDGVGFDTFSYTAMEKAGGQATTDLTIVVVSGGLHYLGGTPNATINGGVYINLLDGSQGHDVLIAGSVATVEIGGPGDTLTGSIMADKFVFNGDFGHNEITNFNPKNDTIWLDHTEIQNYQQVLDDATQVGTGKNATTIINDGKGDVIQLDHVQLSALHASDFYFL